MVYGSIDSASVKQTPVQNIPAPATPIYTYAPMFGPQTTGGTPVQPGGATFGTPSGARPVPATSYVAPLPLVSPTPTSITKTYYNGKLTPDSVVQINYQYK